MVSNTRLSKDLLPNTPSVDLDHLYYGTLNGRSWNYIIQLAPKYFAAAAPSAGSGLKRTEEFIDPEN